MANAVKARNAQQMVTGADVVVQSLVNHGVEVIFAYPGGASMPLHQALTRFKDQLRTILPRHEQGGSFAAQGYARTTGKAGVCMATSGPGATNLVTAIADAKLDSIPLIALTGQVGTSVIGSDAFQETPIVEVCRGITKHHYLVTQRQRYCSRDARSVSHRHHGPAGAGIGRPAQERSTSPGDARLHRAVESAGLSRGCTPRSAGANRAGGGSHQAARRPVIYAGGGIISSGASDELRALVHKTGIPVTTTVMGLGAIRADDPLWLDMLGMHGSVYSNYAVEQADLLLALGVRFDDRVTGKKEEFARDAFIVHIDIDPSEINKNKVAHVGIVSDLKFALTELNKVVEPPDADLEPWHKQIDEWKAADPFHYDETFDGILPQHAIAELSRIAGGENTIVSVGVGQHQMWAAQFYKFFHPRTWMSSSGLGTMGFGLPAAMGAKAAHPDKLVIDIDGDGSFLMNIQELATCFCEKLPVKVLLLNNQHLGMVVQWEDRFFKGNRAHTYLGPIDNPEATGEGDGLGPAERYPNFVGIAHGFGCGARHVKKKSELTAAIKEMLAYDGPYVLDVEVPYQEHVLPMIPAGMTVRDLIKE